MDRTIEKVGVVVEYEGKYWGIQYEDGHSSSEDWGPIEKAQVGNPKFAKKPTDFTWKGSQYIKELKKGKLRTVKKVTTFVVE